MSEFTTDRAVILARGLGKRMKKADDAAMLDEEQARVADTGIKALIPMKRPFLDYTLSLLADAGYRHICLVIGREHAGLRHYYSQELRATRLSIEFALQHEALGTADAVVAAEAWCKDTPFLVLNSDNYYPAVALEELRRARAPAVALFERSAMLAGSNIPSERINAFAVGRHREGRLLRIIEKPSQEVLRSLDGQIFLSMNLWLFDRMIFEACRAIPKSVRGEYEITDAVQWCIDRNAHYSARLISGPVLDLSSRSDVAAAKDRLDGVEVAL